MVIEYTLVDHFVNRKPNKNKREELWVLQWERMERYWIRCHRHRYGVHFVLVFRYYECLTFDSHSSLQGTLHIAMLGLDSAGKTTALYRLKLDQYLNTVTTIGFNCEKVRGSLGKAKGVQFLVWDVGGQEKLRPLWRSYTR